MTSSILFCDIVRFSEFTGDHQRRIIDQLGREMRSHLDRWLNPHTGQPELICLPSGDGLVLVFLEGERPNWDFTDVLRAAICLTRLIDADGQQMRIGIHRGESALITDINGGSYVSGHAINMTQRVMSAADGGQVLLSSDFVEEHLGYGKSIKLVYETEEYSLSTSARMIQVFAKHGRVIEVVPVGLHDGSGNPIPGWSLSEPDAAGEIPIRLTPLPKQIGGLPTPDTRGPTFAEQLSRATAIALIQLTGENLLEEIESGGIQFSPDLAKLLVFMPHPGVVAGYGSAAPMTQLEKLDDCIARWKEVLTAARKDHPMATVKLGLFREPPFLGGSFLDWEQTGGRIHVSPYVWQVEAKRCPGFDLERRGQAPHPVVRAYIRGLEALHDMTDNALDG